MTKPQGKDFFASLQELGLIEYGATIESSLVRELLEIEFPERGTFQQFRAIQLKELNAIDYVRDKLLSQGMYIAGTPTGYRILTPSENQGQIEKYVSSADGKLSRALKLSRNTPRIHDQGRNDQSEARIMMKRAGMKTIGAKL